MTGKIRAAQTFQRLAPRCIMGGILALAIGGSLTWQAPAFGKSATLSATQLNGELQGGYRVAAGDKLRVTVFDEPSLTGEYPIGVGGDLSLPLIAVISAGGKTAQDISAIIAEQLKTGGYVLLPKVSVEIVLHRPFYILGEVNKPGEYPFSGNLTFEQAVAQAGGFTPRANRRTISIRRQEWSISQRVKVADEALKIAPGDTITVRESFF
jgi:polysaccharide biosynthesis/export protein